VSTLLIRALGAVVVVAAFAAGITGFLVVAFDLQIEFAGNGMRPLFSFGAPETHYSALEADRASQAAGSAAPAAETRPAAEEGVDAESGEPAASDAASSAMAAAPGDGVVAADVDATTPAAADLDATAPAAPAHDAYWTDFRGPHRDGVYTQTAIRGEWPADGLEPLWHHPVGGGYASFVIAGGRAFTIEQRRDDEVVAAYDADTGAEAWTHAWPAHFRETMGGPGPRATPTWHDGRVYALGATGRLVSLDAIDGTVIWERDILADAGASNLPWAMSGAPLVVDDLIVVQPGGTRGWSVAAYDRRTGDVVWHGLDDVQSYTSPMLATLDGVRQIVVVTAERAVGLHPSDGALLWDYPWTVPIVPNIAQPLVIGDTQLFLSAGYGKGAALVELTRGGGRFTASTVWESNRMKNKFSSSVLIDGYIYGLDESILACIDAATGELMWKGGRYGHGQLLAAGDHLVVLTERGDLVLVRATPDGHDEVAGFHAIDGKTWNVPAMADGRILVRNARQMAAFDLNP
jgi:outer membrane protein assembly factor BamB